MSKLRVFLADDHTIMRAGLKLLVESQPDMEVVGEASNGKEAIKRARELLPDVIVMDLSMPEMDGAQATEALKQVCPEIKILVLTVHEDEGYLRLLLMKGASGYLLKSGVAEELASAIRGVVQGGTYLDARLADKLVESSVRQPHPKRQSDEDNLSQREMEVLRLTAWGHSNAEIAEQLHVGVRSVETYKTRMMNKLNLRSRTDIVRYALRHGWLKEE